MIIIINVVTAGLLSFNNDIKKKKLSYYAMLEYIFYKNPTVFFGYETVKHDNTTFRCPSLVYMHARTHARNSLISNAQNPEI